MSVYRIVGPLTFNTKIAEGIFSHVVAHLSLLNISKESCKSCFDVCGQKLLSLPPASKTMYLVPVGRVDIVSPSTK